MGSTENKLINNEDVSENLIRKEIIRKTSSLLIKVDSASSKIKSCDNTQVDCNKVSLCVSQTQKMLNLLMKGNKQSYKTVEKILSYVSLCIDSCISKLDSLLMFNDVTLDDSIVQEDECVGRFISKLDRALHKLIILSHSKQYSEVVSTGKNECDWKTLVDDLLFQAVTVAKISGGVDSNEITATCHKILKECQELECSDSLDLSVWKLHCEILGDALMQLERRVSSALLRLLLKVFSDAHLPLKRLINSIGNSVKQNRNVKDLDKIVEEFDYHNECIQHLCLFALAFSDDKKNMLPIKCCLASLESLDDSLVPAVLDLYLDQTNRDKLCFLKFLVEHWTSEVNNLESLLDSIIDPTAFISITLQSIQCNLERARSAADFMIESTHDNTCKIESSSYYGMFNNIITEAQRLMRYLKQCHDNDITGFKLKLKLVTNECRHILKLPLNANDYKSVISRTLKRFDLLVAVINKISNKLSLAAAVGCMVRNNNYPDDTSNDNFQNTTSLLNRVEITSPSSGNSLLLDKTEISDVKNNQSRKIGRGDFFQNVYFANLHKKKGFNEDSVENNNGDEVEHYVSNLMSKHTFGNTLYEPSPRKKPGVITPRGPLYNPLESVELLCCQESVNSSCCLEITDILENLERNDCTSDTVSTIDNDMQNLHLESIITTNTAGTSTVFSLLPSDISSDLKLTNQFNRTEEIMTDLRLIEKKLSLLKR